MAQPAFASAAHRVTLASEIDFDGWRDAARAAGAGRVCAPEEVEWEVERQLRRSTPGPRRDCSRSRYPLPVGEAASITVDSASPARAAESSRAPSSTPRETAILHSDPAAFRLPLPHAVAACRPSRICCTSPPIRMSAGSRRWTKAIRRDIHKMRAFVRFRQIGDDDGRALCRLVRAGAFHRRAQRDLLRAPVHRHALVDPDALPPARIGTARR